MSCEHRHRTIVSTLLTLAGLHATVPVDEVMGVGVANRRRRGELPTPDATVPVSLHADAQRALAITGHSDHATPSWVAALIDRLHAAADRGSRRAFLTKQFLTGGAEVVTPHLTWSDSAWLLTAKRVGIQVPSVWEDRIVVTRPPVADIRRLLGGPVMDAVVLTDILEAVNGIDAIPPDAAQTVTPLQVLRFLLGGSFSARTDLQRVLRAVIDGKPVVRETVTRMTTVYGSGWVPNDALPYALIGCAAGARRRSVEQAGRDAVLKRLTGWIRHTCGITLDPSTLRDPSPTAMTTITSLLQRKRIDRIDTVVRLLTALMHVWQTNGRDDAVTAVVRTLERVLVSKRDDSFVLPMVVIPIITGAGCPPHGDAFGARLCDPVPRMEWTMLAAGAVYAAACHRIGHVPSVDRLGDSIRDRWRTRRLSATPSSIPVLAVGREQELLVPVLRAERDRDRRCQLLADVIDAMDMIDMVGGDPQGMHAVLADAVTMDGADLDPRIVVRLAASRCGQSIVASLPFSNLPSSDVWDDSRLSYRLVRHLVSPWWATAPSHLHTWWEREIEWVAASNVAGLLTNPPPLYPIIAPQVAMIAPTSHLDLVRRAVGNPQWDAIPAPDRRHRLTTVVGTVAESDRFTAMLAIALWAATDAAHQDMVAMLPTMEGLSDRQKDVVRYLINSNGRGSA